MMINKGNYELYAIDFLEDNLDEETHAEMIQFLNNHPELKGELEAMMQPAVMIADISMRYEPKSALKKEETKRVIWIPSLMKYASAVALLLSIGSVWYLNKIDFMVSGNIAVAEQVKENKNLNKNASETSVNKNTQRANTNNNLNENKNVQEVNTRKANTKKSSIQEINKNLNTNSTVNTPVGDRTNQVTNQTQITEQTVIVTNEKTATKVNITKPRKRIKFSTTPVNLQEKIDINLSNKSIASTIKIASPTNTNMNPTINKNKVSWIINAITKKSDGTNIFAFEGVKRALTPTRLRDVNTGSTSIDSPLKQLTND